MRNIYFSLAAKPRNYSSQKCKLTARDFGLLANMLAFLALFLASANTHAAQESNALWQVENGWTLVPESRPFPLLFTDVLDAKTSWRFGSSKRREAFVGAYRSIFAYRKNDYLMHFGIEGQAFFQMVQEGSRFVLQSSDGQFGIYFDGSNQSWTWQLRFHHISAHLSDGVDRTTAIRYSREYVQLRLLKEIGWFQPYIGVRALVHTIPAGLPVFGGQVGTLVTIPVGLRWFRVITGFDYKQRGGEEGHALNISLGGEFVSEQNASPVRLLAHYFTGHDHRGQNFRNEISKFVFGFELEI